MKKKSFLILTEEYLDKNYFKKKKIVLLNNNKSENNNLSYINFNKPSKNQILRWYRFCNKLKICIFNDLYPQLNKLHNTQYSKKFWKIVVENWIHDFILINFKIFIQQNYIFKKYKIDNVYVPNLKKLKFKSNHSLSIFAELEKSDKLFIFFQIKILEYFKYSKIINYYNYKLNKKNKLKKIKKKKKNSIFIYIYSKIFKLFSFFINFQNYGVIKNTYIPFIYEKILEIKLFQIPSIWPTISIKHKSINLKLRSKINLQSKKSSTDFENYIRAIIPNILPKSFIENFSYIKKVVKKIYPQNPKFIFSSVDLVRDDQFKIYSALQKEFNKTVIYCGQHGGNFFSQIHTRFLPDIKIFDNFISWGDNKTKKTIPAFNFKILGKNYSFNNEGKFLIVFSSIYRNYRTLYSYDHQPKNEIINFVNIIKNLKPEIRKKTVIRISQEYLNNFFGIKYIDYFKDLDFHYIDSNSNFYDLLKNSRLVLFDNYSSTGAQETLGLNIPTIIFSEDSRHIHHSYMQKYELLLRNNILFEDKIKIINFINTNWNNIHKWWFNKDKERVIKTYIKNFNIRPKKQSLEFLKKKLLKTHI